MKRRQDATGTAAEGLQPSPEAEKDSSKGNAGGELLQRGVALALFVALLILYFYERAAKQQLAVNYELKELAASIDIQEMRASHLDEIRTLRMQLEVESEAKLKTLSAAHAEQMIRVKDVLPVSPPCAACPICDAKTGMVAIEEKALFLQSKYDRVKLALKDLSQDLLRLRFGPEPYTVELQLQLPAEAGVQETGTVTLEMAPAELMPVAVLLFLDHVDRGAWNGCSFIRNAGHVLQSGVAGERCDRSKFHNRHGGMRSIPFLEYSPKYPHEQFTIGYAGRYIPLLSTDHSMSLLRCRPGGPDFYFSLKNNSIPHGPGGQGPCEIPNTTCIAVHMIIDAVAMRAVDQGDSFAADACFGRVTSGTSFILKMHSLPIDPNDTGFKLLKSFVTIVSARILENK